MPKGGARRGAGRKKLKPESPLVDGNRDFATRVLARVGKPGWLEYSDLKKVKSDEDYALHLVIMGKGEHFHRLLDRKYGKAVQQIRLANPEGEKFQVEIDVSRIREKLLAKLGG
jgi:hypothetical protein